MKLKQHEQKKKGEMGEKRGGDSNEEVHEREREKERKWIRRVREEIESGEGIRSRGQVSTITLDMTMSGSKCVN